MESYLKYFLNFILLGLLLACEKSNTVEDASLNTADRKSLSKKHFETAEKYTGQGTPTNMRLIETAIKLDPDNAAAWRELSVPYLKRGIPHEWKPLFDSAVKKDPISWRGWRGYLKLYFYRDYEGAILDFNATDSLTPNFTDYPQGQSVDYMRGLCYLGLKDYQKAKSFFLTYINEVTLKSGENWVDVNAFLYCGITYSRLQKPDTAIIFFDKGIKNYDKFSDGFFHKANIKLELGKSTEALELLISGKELFKKGYFHQREYVEVQEQLYLSDFDELENKIKIAMR